jgi:hypothetical protein
MKRPVIGTIVILALLAGGLYLGFTYRAPATDATRNSSGPAARAAIQASLDLMLPPTANAVQCHEQDVERAKRVYARFDVPSVELPELLEQAPIFPKVAELKPNAELVTAMAGQSDPVKRPWWDLAQAAAPSSDGMEAGVTAAQRSGRRNAAPAVLKWRVQMAAMPFGPGVTRVYVAFTEEPAGE